MSRAARVAWWTAPSLLCLILYWFGLMAWFQQDDFAWLGLDLLVTDTRSFLEALFRPMAQGTIRPLSERLFFMTFVTLFGMEALPFRIAVFLTMFADLALLAAVMHRLTGSRIAGFAAPCLWVVNAGLATPLSWTSAYNQVLSSFFLLLAFWFFLRYTETSERRYYWLQTGTFLLGFGALELNVVYPALAALYALCCARRYLLATLPLFIVSGIYTLIHRSVAPPQRGTLYRMYFDTSIFETLWTYMRWIVGTTRVAEAERLDPAIFIAAECIAGAGVLLAIAWAIRRRQWLVLFFTGWFFVTIGPVLPLKNHISDYYMTIPAIGLAMLGGWATAQAWHARAAWVRIVAAVCLLAYAVPSARGASKQVRYNYDGSQRAKAFLQRVAYAHKRHPGKILLIQNIDSELFWAGFFGDPFRIFGLRDVYLTADSEPHVVSYTDAPRLSSYFLADSAALAALRTGRAVVYQIDGHELRNITPVYTQILADRASDLDLSARIDVANPLFQSQVIEGFHDIEEGGFRWMSKRGVVRLRGPRTPAERLEITGRCHEQQMEKGPLRLTVAVNGRVLTTHEIRRDNLEFTFRTDLPADLIGKKAIEVAIEVDRTFSTPSDERRLGVVIASVSVGS
jgi:hypothetical protein